MKKYKLISKVTAAVMLIAAAVFIGFALTHPEASFPWSNGVTYLIYGVYAAVTVLLFIAPQKKNKSEGQNIQ